MAKTDNLDHATYVLKKALDKVEIARRLNCSPRTVQEYWRTGQLESFIHNRSRRSTRAQVAKFINLKMGIGQ